MFLFFCSHSRTRIKTLAWDGSGLWLCTKRLERGTFDWLMPADTEVAAAELQALLAGLEIQGQRPWYRR